MNHDPRPTGCLPRLPSECYCGQADVFWTHTVADRGIGWLTDRFHATFREIALHTAFREALLCPEYTLMPDHLHLLWMGVNPDSNQRTATEFLRRQLAPLLKPHKWQHQPHDRVLRSEERTRDAIAATCYYVGQNPVRAGLVSEAKDWPYTGCLVPGYPVLSPFQGDFWERFWRFYCAACETGGVGKLKLTPGAVRSSGGFIAGM